MLGRGHQQITRTPHVEIPHIMERPMRLLVPIGRVTTMRARVPEVVATVEDDLGLGQGCGCGDPGAGVGSVLTWTVHRVALLAQRFGPALYAKRLLRATRCCRYSLNLRSVWTTLTCYKALEIERHGYAECCRRLGHGDEAVAIALHLEQAQAVADISIHASCLCRQVPESGEELHGS